MQNIKTTREVATVIWHGAIRYETVWSPVKITITTHFLRSSTEAKKNAENISKFIIEYKKLLVKW